MRKPPNIALLGADDPLGEAILRLLSEREIEVGEIYPLTFSETEGCVSARGVEIPLIEASGFDWPSADWLINASRSAAAERLAGQAAQAGCRTIGLGSGAEEAGHTRLAGALSVAVQRVLAPIHPVAPLQRVSVVAMLPVAAAGEAGVAELASQTRALFAMESAEPEVFPLQMAFNLIPQVGVIDSDGGTRIERDTAEEIRELLGLPVLPVSVTAIWAPMFYGAALTVHAVCEHAIDIAALRLRLTGQAGVTLMEADLPGGVPTPATDALDSEGVFVGRFRSGGGDRDLAMWLVVDMTRLEAARIVDCLENFIEK